MNKLYWIFFSLFVLVLQACSSSGPATSYYALMPAQNINAVNFEHTHFSLGVGPVKLPEFLEHPGIVSVGEGNRVIVSGYNAWAGDLKTNISRVVAANLSKALKHQEIYAFPWDARTKPHYQLRLEFDNFSGERGGEVQANVRWILLDREGKALLQQAKLELAIDSRSSSYNDYVAALNQSIDALSQHVAGYLVEEFSP